MFVAISPNPARTTDPNAREHIATTLTEAEAAALVDAKFGPGAFNGAKAVAFMTSGGSEAATLRAMERLVKLVSMSSVKR